MKSVRMARLGVVALALGARFAADATTILTETPVCGEKTEKICQALRIPSPGRRVAEARAALEEALKAEDPHVARAVGAMVQKLRSRVDLRPFADLFATACEKSKGRCFWGPAEEDWSLVWAGSRSERLDVFERAIRSGSAQLARGTLVQRRWAVRYAAEQGLEELRPLSSEYIATLTEARLKKLDLANVPSMFELCSGAGGYVDAARRAGSRIAVLPDQEFEIRMSEDEGFRDAVLLVAGRVCETDPLMNAVAPECSLVAAVANRYRRTTVPGNVVWPTDTCWAAKAEDWREKLWCVTRPGSRIEPGKVGVFEPLNELASPRKGDYRRTGLDPCSVPELPERGGNDTLPDVWVTLTDLSASPPRVIDASVGIVGHRAGERVRIGVDVMDRKGRRPDTPALVSIRLEGEQAGALALSETPSTCSKLLLPWSDAEKAGFRLPERREFELTLGKRAVPAGILPSGRESGRPTGWWHESGRIHVSVFGVAGDLGAIGAGHEEIFALRAESGDEAAWNRLSRLESDLGRHATGAVIMDADMEDRAVVVRGPVRQFLFMRRLDEKRGVIAAECSISGERGDVSRVSLVAHRIPGTSLFVAPFTLFPDGYPEPDTPPGRGVLGPILKITVGESNTSCVTREEEKSQLSQ